MYKDGKPDHEAPMHSRQKLELSAKAEAAIREQMQAQGRLLESLSLYQQTHKSMLTLSILIL